MKKTLFTILACCLSLSTAQAVMKDINYDITLTFDELTPGVAAEAGFMEKLLMGTPKPGEISGSVENLELKDGTNYVDSFMAPNVNIGSTASSWWTYTCSFVAGADFTFNSLSLDMLTFNNAGNTQNAPGDKTSDLKVTLTRTAVNGESYEIAYYGNINQGEVTFKETNYKGTGTTSALAPKYDPGKSIIGQGVEGDDDNQKVSGANVAMSLYEDLDSDKLKIQAGDTLILTVAAQHNDSNNDGHFVGLGAVRFNVTVPEPATATLSLLALAGLAARRRRK